MKCIYCRNRCSICTRPSRRGKGGTAREFMLSERRYGFQRSKQVPFLRMSGNWLRDLGFRIGTRVTVEAKKGQLVITVVKEPEQRPVRSTRRERSADRTALRTGRR